MRKVLATCVALAAAGLGLSLAVWSRVPDPMPIHWDAGGVADGWAPRAFGLLFAPLLGALVSAVAGGLAASHPGSRTIAGRLTVAIGAFHLGLHALVVQAALEPSGAMHVGVVMALVAVLLAVLGQALPRVGPNPWVGVRLPWTRSNEVVWSLTHRFAARSMVTAAVLAVPLALLAPAPLGFWVAFGVVMAGALAPVPYSYALHRMRR